ncbi:MAG: type II toxin-antitoxin system death-on-curing family toxin, partial [Patescibacteria group bacterium]
MIASLTTEAILQIHADVIENSGGSLGVRDLNLVHSAVQRMHASAFGIDLYTTIWQKAAALFHSLVKNHGFVDGNKRTATISLETFLDLNKSDRKQPKDKLLEDFVLLVA